MDAEERLKNRAMKGKKKRAKDDPSWPLIREAAFCVAMGLAVFGLALLFIWLR